MWVFAVLFAVSSVACLAAVLFTRSTFEAVYRVERAAPDAQPQGTPTLYELACLSGHLGELAVCQLHRRRGLTATPAGRVGPRRTRGVKTFDAAVLAAIGPAGGDLIKVAKEVGRRPEAKALRRKLVARGLMRDERLIARHDRATVWASAACVLTVLAGLVSLGVVVSRHGNALIPLGAFALLIGLMVLSGRRLFGSIRGDRTPLGDRVVELADADPRWRDELGQVALEGYWGLPPGHPLRRPWEASRAREAAEERARAAEMDHANNGGGNGGI
ncbi:TIGR04222 domain-containing membrane protein [Streptomyces sp. FH025]|uniref:TIGR04222 domain-containing membrane protein n=1 Tax=Streptomyces sp. FH025 TaxID=2815937 RepID=UPI001A9D0EBB|nr:TIGR04222 domain-containing membrane protein [Streptomyces sp. FH025]MBO1418330.1 TIGR04222 domain-containing membrane protein [Streptomyces sp. FH025]